MSKPDGSRVFLHVLATVATCAEDIDSEIVGIDFDLFSFVGLGQDFDEGKTRVASVVGVEG